jgi:LacI family transcriptional regulator
MVTIREIARAVGVSASTVSRVLNYDETLSVSAAKRQAIIETAESLNYATPRNRNRAAAAAALVVAPETTRIAFVHFLDPDEEFADPYYIGVRLGIEQRCRAARLEIDKFYPSEGFADATVLRNAAGVIVVGRHTEDEVEWIASHNANVVFADYTPPGEVFDSVHIDLYYATIRLLEALHATGYRRIAFVGVQETRWGKCVPMADRRYPAYLEWTQARGLYDSSICLLGDLRVERGYELTRNLLDLPQRPEVIVTSNDNMAIGAYRAISEKGLSIPDDIGIASFNDIPVAQFLTPPLSTVKIHAEHIGEAAVDLLLERIAGRDFGKRLVIATEMIWRGSCRTPS